MKVGGFIEFGDGRHCERRRSEKSSLIKRPIIIAIRIARRMGFYLVLQMLCPELSKDMFLRFPKWLRTAKYQMTTANVSVIHASSSR